MDKTDPQLTYQFPDIKSLRKAYMPFVHDGGIFIPTEEQFHLGEFINLTVTLPNTEESFTFLGEIIWITPKTSTRIPGVGVQCNDEKGEAFNAVVQNLLGDIFDDEGESDTM